MPKDPKLTFAAAYTQLQQILSESEKSPVDLETQIKHYKEAAQLSKFLKSELDKMAHQIEEINLESVPETPAAPKAPEPDAPDDSSDIPF